MADPQPQFKYPSLYSPGQMAFNDNAEMSRLISMFAGPMMQGMAGPGNFLPHMTPSQNVMDQYMTRQYQNQTRASEFYMAGAGNQDVSKRLLAMRTMSTDAPASELNKSQAEQFAGLINNPMTKSVLGMMMGPENVEAALHGRKGDVAGLNQVVNRMGFFRNDPSGGKRMDASSLEDFSRGVYAHLYDEGGNLGGVERDARAAGGNTATYNNNADVKSLKKFAKMEDSTVVSDDEVKERVIKRINTTQDLSAEDVATTYKKYVAGDATDTTQQVEALTKFDGAIKSLDQLVKGKSADQSGLLGEKEVTVDKTVKQARENRLGEVNGFMAGQVGQMSEQMFQRGMLPQAVGAMTPAERVKLISKERERDPETLDRLAKEFGHRDMMARDANYAGATEEKQREMLAPKLGAAGGYHDKIKDVLNATDEFNAGKRTDVQQIEKMEGFDSVAGNVDSKRSAAAIKKYTGAVAAVREIFGDNGSPNAPMPALMAALDHLSQGASSQMDPKQIESSLRAMQQMAKESGVGFEQMAGMAAQMGASGDMLGISKSQTMHNQVNVMAMVKTMRDTGTFSKPQFGAMNQAEATQLVAQKMQAGEASDNSRTMSALAGIYKADKTAFKPDSEFALAMEAYNDPSSLGNYTIKGPDGKPINKNIFEVVGKGGPQALQQMAKAAGVREGQISAAFMNPASQQFATAGAGFQTQKYEMLRDINNMSISGTLNTQLQAANKAAPGSELAKHSGSDPSATADATGQAITEMILESSGMEQGEQIAFMKKSMVPTLTAAFMKSGVTDEKEAQKLAEQAASVYMGADPTQQSGRIKELIDSAGAFVFDASGMTMPAAAGMYAGGKPAKSMQEAERNRAIGGRKAATGLNFSSHPLARMSDYLLETGEKGGKVTAGGMFDALAQAIPEQELRDKYSQGMAPGVETVQTALNEMSVTDPYIKALASTQYKEDKDAETVAKDTATLKQLAGVDAKTAIVTDADFAARHTAKMADTLKDGKKVTETFKRVFKEDNTALSVDEQRTALSANKQFQDEQAGATLNAGEMTQAQVTQAAAQKGINPAYIAELASKQTKNKDKSPETLARDTATLRTLAGLTAETKIVSDADFETRRTAKMAAIRDKDVETEFSRIFNEKETKLSVAEQRTRLMSNEQFKTEQGRETLNADEMTQTQVNQRALNTNMGALRPRGANESEEQFTKRKQNHENLETMRTSFFEGTDPTKLNAGVSAALDYFDIDATKTNDKGETIGSELTKLVSSFSADPAQQEEYKNRLAEKMNELVSDSGGAVDETSKSRLLGVLEGQRTGAAFDVGGVTGQIGQAAGAAQQVAQQIANAQIRADKVTINAGSVDGTGKPAADGAAGPAGVDATADKSNAAAPGAPTPVAARTDAEAAKPLQETLPGGPPLPATGAAPATASPPATGATPATGAAPATGAGQPAVAAPPDKQYDVDPKDFTDSKGKKDRSYASIGEGKFRDQKGNPIARPTEGAYFDVMNVVDPKEVAAREQKDKKGRTGRVGQIGEKYYEQYMAGGVAEAWREITVGENKPGAQAVTKDAPGTTPEASATPATVAVTAATGAAPATADAATTATSATPTAGAATTATGAATAATGAAPATSTTPATPATVAVTTATSSAPTTAAAAVKSATDASQQAVAANPNIVTAQPVTPSGGGGGGGGSGGMGGGGGQQTTTITGELRITNLEAGVLEVMAKQSAPPTQTEGGGAAIHTAKATGK